MGKRLDKLRKAVADWIYPGIPEKPTPPPEPVAKERPQRPMIHIRPNDCSECKCKELTGYPCSQLVTHEPSHVTRFTSLDRAINYYRVNDERTKITRMAQKYIATLSCCAELNVALSEMHDQKRKHLYVNEMEKFLHARLYEHLYQEVIDELHEIQCDIRDIEPMGCGPDMMNVFDRVSAIISKLQG